MVNAGIIRVGVTAPAITAPTTFYRLADENDSAGSLNLTNTGPVTFVAGHIGNCAHFAANKFLGHASAASLQLGVGVDGSWCFWVKVPSYAAHQALVAKYDSGTREYQIYVPGFGAGQAWNIVFLWYQNGTTQWDQINTSNIAAAALGTWIQVAFVWNTAGAANQKAGYSLNGAAFTYPSAANLAGLTSIYAGTSVFYLGAYFGGTGDCLSDIDAMGWWKSHVLTDAEVSALYNGGTGREYYSGAWH